MRLLMAVVYIKSYIKYLRRNGYASSLTYSTVIYAGFEPFAVNVVLVTYN